MLVGKAQDDSWQGSGCQLGRRRLKCRQVDIGVVNEWRRAGMAKLGRNAGLLQSRHTGPVYRFKSSKVSETARNSHARRVFQ